ncbi:hypothetical protein Pyn_11435 [Prunus yedoensis var. nudiflora]|uniref:Myb/SANT-like domain-containing protein n=1 Tax=Prunus yedoensis var. nudiflora TaxID=2094558 RepID=A0A314Y046_PRUYE|nr:hypothetical protein Pyn_01110 [Prunus yedoensis var. nudiflora]PQQ02758.1 hypothetical protein Pyn_11435 [Prunus yedoensis var. nudiflora]
MSKGKANRYVWQANEEEALLNILDELVASGQHCDAGTFKAGTMKLVETQLKLLIPHTPIRVFGKDRATGNSSLAPTDMVLDDDDEASESNIPNVLLDGNHNNDQTQAQSKSSSSRNKRVRQGNKMVDGLGRIANAFESMMENSDAKKQRLVESLKEHNADDDHKFVGDEIKKMEFSVSYRISVLTLFTNSAKVHVFKTLDEGDDKYEYVTTLLKDHRSRG